MRQKRREKAVSDLDKLADIQPEINASAQFASLYIQCQMLVGKVNLKLPFMSFILTFVRERSTFRFLV